MTSAASPVVAQRRTPVEVRGSRQVKPLGNGNNGDVFLFEEMNPSAKKVALKVINIKALVDDEIAAQKMTRSKTQKIDKRSVVRARYEERIGKEIDALKTLNHPNIIKYAQADVIPESIPLDHVAIPMEYFDSEQLLEAIIRVKRFQTVDVRNIGLQIVEAVQYTYSQEMTHRDVKPENILIDQNLNIRIVDFGMVQSFLDEHRKERLLNTSCGSAHYCSPEVAEGKPYGKKSEVWTLGVILFCLAAGHLPFDNEDIPTLLKMVMNGNYTIPTHVDKSLADLISKMIVKDVETRYSIEQVLSHAFFAPSPKQQKQFRALAETPVNMRDDDNKTPSELDSNPNKRTAYMSSPTSMATSSSPSPANDRFLPSPSVAEADLPNPSPSPLNASKSFEKHWIDDILN